MRLRYLVTGTGRCGSVTLAKTLTSLGINCGHETIFSFDGLENAKKRLRGDLKFGLSGIARSATGQGEREWFSDGIHSLQADSSYMAAPFIDDPLFNEVSVIHLVRDPMQVINSFVEGFGYFRDCCLNMSDEGRYHRFIYRHVPRVASYKLPVDRAAAFYIEWNKMIEEKAKKRRYIRFNINKKSYFRLFKFLEMEEPENFVQRKLNERHTKKRFSCISQIEAKELRNEITQLYTKYCYIKV